MKKELRNATVELTIRNDVIFKKVFSKKKIIKPFLEDLTGSILDDIQIVDAEKTMYPSAKARYNRFDVFLLNNDDVYDTEMQNGNFEDILQRAMHHASVLEAENTPSGLVDMRNIEDVWVIFICTEDFMKLGERKYELETVVKNHTDIGIPQYRHIIFLNAKGKKMDLGEKINGFLEYLDKLKNPGNNEFVKEVEAEVEEAKTDPSTREAVMTLEQMLYWREQEGLKQGREEGRTEGREEGTAEIIRTLHESGMTAKEISDRLHIEYAKVLAIIEAGKPK